MTASSTTKTLATEIHDIRQIECPQSALELFSDWIDSELTTLESEWNGFTTRSAVKTSIGR